MRKILLVCLFSGCFSGLKAQSWIYHPFPTDSAVWTNIRGTYNVVTTSPLVVDYYPEAPDRYCLPGTDTIIGSSTYSKVYWCGAAYKGGLRDDLAARKVYFVPADSTSELLIYDFSVQAGDTAHVYEQNHYGNEFYPVVYPFVSVDSILINGSYRKRISFSNPGQWIEGIGCTQGLFREAWPNVSNWYTGLECMSDGDMTLYPTASLGPCSLVSEVIENIEEANAFEVFPNPANDKISIRSVKQMNSLVMTDLLGRLVYSCSLKSNTSEIDIVEQPSGIYFMTISDTKGNSVTKKIIKQ